MKSRFVVFFLLGIFSLYIAQTTRAYWIQNNGQWIWYNGQVTGGTGKTDEVIYVVKSHTSPTSTPTNTPTPTPTDTPTPTNTPTPTTYAGSNAPDNTQTAFITLSAFNAQWVNNVITITWSTIQERNNNGFDLYKSTSSNGTYTKINNNLIPSTCNGCSGGAHYSFVDSDIFPNQTYYYKLRSTTSQIYGPVSVRTPEPTPTPTLIPTRIPTPTPFYCGSMICNITQLCYNNVCRQPCGQNSSCLGDYVCRIPPSACVPATLSSTGTANRTPTATPYPTYVQPTRGDSSSSSSYAAPTLAPTALPAPTNLYPTQIPVVGTFFNDDGSGSPPPPSSIPLPVVTNIPDQLKGKKSTIVIELPSRPPTSPFAPTPTPASLVLKGEELKDIIIDVFKPPAARAQEPKQATTQNASNTASDLNILIERKQGTDIAITQQEFVIQKGMRSVTITSNSQNAGTLSIGQNDTKATVTMSISIDPTTNIMTVDTPSGPMKVSIMPDDAVAIIRQLKVMNQNGVPNSVVLEVRNNQLEYKIKAEKSEKLFWIIPINILRDIYVSADNGGVIAVKKSALNSFLTLFTF